MKVEMKDAPKSQKELFVELPVEAYEKAFEAEYKSIAPTIEIKGFRKGKAPKAVILKDYQNKISVNALEKLINTSVMQSVTEQGITPLSQPDVKDVKFEENEPITFKVFVDVYPEFEVNTYTGFAFENEVEKVAEEDVEKALVQLQEKNTSFEPAEDGAEVQDGDMTVIDFEGRIDGELFDGGSAKGHQIVVGTNTFIAGFEEQMIGMKAGEVKDIEVTFPETYHEKSFAGKPAVFTVTLHDIKHKSVPALDDDFAKDVDEDCETLADLKAKLSEDLAEELRFMAKERLFDKMLNKIIEENAFEIPGTMVVDQAGRLADQTLQQYQQMYGMSPEQLGLSKEKVMPEMMDRASVQVKSALILNKIADIEEVVVSDAEVDEKIKEYAEKMKRSFDDYKAEIEKFNGMANVQNNVLTDKLYNYLVENNDVTEVVMTREELEAKFQAEQEKQAEDTKEEK